MQFLADENISRLVIARLRADGLDVTAISETQASAPDNVVLKTAELEARILITEDRDFGELVIRQKLAVLGIVLLELDRLSNAGEVERVSQVLRLHKDKLKGCLMVIEPNRVRMRPLR